MKSIAKSAIIGEGAVIDDDVTVGHYSIIENNVIIKRGTTIEDHVLLKEGTEIGENNRICHSALIGGVPQDLKFKGWKTGVKIGNNNTIREFVTIHRATEKDGLTTIGNNCFLMAYVHIAHDCSIGNNVIIANATQLGGFTEIEDFAFLSALIPVHQYSRIGSYSIIGGGYRITKDVVPFAMAGGEPLKIYGLNIVGLRRNNFKKETISLLKMAYSILFDKGINTTQAVSRIKRELPQTAEIKNILTFIEKSKRGIAKR